MNWPLISFPSPEPPARCEEFMPDHIRGAHAAVVVTAEPRRPRPRIALPPRATENHGPRAVVHRERVGGVVPDESLRIAAAGRSRDAGKENHGQRGAADRRECQEATRQVLARLRTDAPRDWVLADGPRCRI